MVYIKGNFKMNKSLIGIVIAYITGIILAYFLDFPYKEMFMMAIITLLLSLFFFKRKKFKSALVIFYLTMLLAGTVYSEYRANSCSKFITPFLNNTEEVTLRGTIKSDIDIRPNKYMFSLECENIEDNKGLHPIKGKVQVIYTGGEGSLNLDDFPFRYRDAVEVKGILQLPPETTVPGVFDYRKYLQRQGISGLIFVRDIDKITTVEQKGGPGNFLNCYFISIRHKLFRIITCSLPQPQASILFGILLGGHTGVPSDIQEAFINTGVMHILAVSGFNIGVIAGFFLLFFKRIYLPHKIAAFITIAIVFIYTLITGAQPSAMRAAVMATFALGAFILERDKNFYQSLALTCLVILLVNPLDLLDVGFQLSFSATLAILYFTPRIQALLKFLPRWLVNSIAVTTAAQIGIIPIIAYYFNKISLAGMVANIIVIPLVAVITVTGFLTFFVSFLGMFFLQIWGWMNGLLITGMVEIVKLFTQLPYAFIYIPTPSFIFIGSYYFFAGWLGWLNRVSQIRKFGIVILSVVLLWFSFSGLIKSRQLTVTFLDVGQGDAIFLEFPDRTNMLIDGGGSLNSNFNIGERIVAPFLWHKRIIKIDRLVLTHPHYNHLNGLLGVLTCFSVGKVIINGQDYATSEYIEFLDIIKQKHIPLEILRAPCKVTLDKDIIWEVLNPPMLNNDNSDIAIDNNSIVSRVIYGSFSILFTGDIRKEIQEKLSLKDIKSTILQIPHHAKNELSQRFLLKVAPECVIISAKKYRENVLKELGDFNIYSTNLYGTIVITTDGEKYRLRTFRPL